MKSDIEEKLRDDNSKVAESLENMMALHTELQCKYESLQIELGKKDTQLNQHKKDKLVPNNAIVVSLSEERYCMELNINQVLSSNLLRKVPKTNSCFCI